MTASALFRRKYIPFYYERKKQVFILIQDNKTKTQDTKNIYTNNR